MNNIEALLPLVKRIGKEMDATMRLGNRISLR